MLQVRTDKQLWGSWKQLLFFYYPPPNPTTIRCFSWSSKNISKVNSITPICFLNGTNSGTVVGRIEFYRDDRFTLAGVPLISRDACSGLYYLWYLYEVIIFYFFFADWCLFLRCAQAHVNRIPVSRLIYDDTKAKLIFYFFFADWCLFYMSSHFNNDKRCNIKIFTSKYFEYCHCFHS